MIGDNTLKKIGKNIIAASVSGTLALMGAPPEAARSGANVEVASFQPADVRLVGTITAKGTVYVLTDPKTGVVTELRGKGIKRFVGMSVTIEGTMAGRPAAESGNSTLAVQVVRITSNANQAMQSSLVSKRQKIGVGLGAAGGTLGGLYASGVLGGDDKPASRK